MVLDAVGASESGAQMSTFDDGGRRDAGRRRSPRSPTPPWSSADLDRVLEPGEGQGWLARRDLIPLGYLGDAAKTAKTFPTIDGVRWSVPGDRANVLRRRPDPAARPRLGHHQLRRREDLRRGGRARDRRAPRRVRRRRGRPPLGALGQRGGGGRAVRRGRRRPPTRNSSRCARTPIARYKIPKAFIRTAKVVRSPAGKADYRWAKELATEGVRSE